MSKVCTNILTFALSLLLLSSCSVQKNTWATRTYHQMKVRYNIFFNGDIAYREGQQQIIEANQDDYSAILPLYPVSNHTAAETSAAKMDLTIEKCRKCIKLHSIKKKPKADPKKMHRPEYKAWLKQEEFNNQMGNAWLRLGEAEFHKGDFLGSVGTFNYIQRHYDYDPDMVARCQLWVARAYAEMGWLYEAEDMLQKVDADALSRKHAALYSAVSADVLLKTKHYREAAPFVKIAMPSERRKEHRPRFAFVLGQLYEREGRRDDARQCYTRVIRMFPQADMEFQARLRRAQLEGAGSVKRLERMARLDKYKDQLDQIYGAVGNVLLSEKDTVRALTYYQRAIDESTQSGLAKAAVLLTAGDLYYERSDYEHAQPCYSEVVSIISPEHEEYARVNRRSEVLSELIVATSTITLQDSLQHLASLSEEEQRAVVDRIIENLIAEEKRQAEEAAQAEREAARDEGPNSVNTSKMIGGTGVGEWYFYNQQLLRNGKQEFRRKWGNRTLEDNWRRLSKATSSFFPTEAEEESAADEQLTDSLAADSTATLAATETDNHKPEYYLQQIPRTPEDIAASDTLIADALYDLIFIYEDKLGDAVLADQALEELRRRFPTYARLTDIENTRALKERIRRDPLFVDSILRSSERADSLYEQTYRSYTRGDYHAVKLGKQTAEREFAASALTPRFVFLNAVAVARTEGQEAFVDELREMVARYPTSELGSMAKDMLAMMGQGMEAKRGDMTSNLDELRGKLPDAVEDSALVEKTFSADRNEAGYVLLLLPEQNEQLLNNLLYEVALFNFSQFLIRDFDMQTLSVYGTGSALRISGFDSLDETDWYRSLMDRNTELQQVFSEMHVTPVGITESNYPLLMNKYTLEQYLSFLEQ